MLICGKSVAYSTLPAEMRLLPGLFLAILPVLTLPGQAGKAITATNYPAVKEWAKIFEAVNLTAFTDREQVSERVLID